MEQWKVITDYPDYECSNEGRVRRISDGFVRKWTDNGKGALTMSFKGGRNGNTNRTQVYLMRTHWKYEFIKDLYDDEECKVCPDYPDYYITNYGRFFSLKRYTWMDYHVRTAKRGFHDRDYHSPVRLTKDGKTFNHDVSRLVGKAFLPDFQENLLVLHIDETLPPKTIHHVNNLKMGTYSDNAKDIFIKGRYKNR
jgi:hypothetical protein